MCVHTQCTAAMPTTRSTAESCLVWFGMVWFGLVWFGSFRACLDRFVSFVLVASVVTGSWCLAFWSPLLCRVCARVRSFCL